LFRFRNKNHFLWHVLSGQRIVPRLRRPSLLKPPQLTFTQGRGMNMKSAKRRMQLFAYLETLAHIQPPRNRIPPAPFHIDVRGFLR
jgi:hypothetical protein